jgi:hypothetical protein
MKQASIAGDRLPVLRDAVQKHVLPLKKRMHVRPVGKASLWKRENVCGSGKYKGGMLS